jgi:putative heme transporter
MLVNGRRYADWLVHRAGVPARVMVPLAEDSASAIRGYAWGTTIVAAANAIPIGLTAWLLGLPLVAAITLVTFITAYIPYFGAIFAGFFVCLIALGAEGVPVALAMLVVILVVNNVLQSALAPVAYGVTLNLDPLVVLLVTVGAGIVGGIGLIVIAAPLTSIVVRAGERISESRRVEPAVESPVVDEVTDDLARVGSEDRHPIEEEAP